jgi:hypothetical protein
MSDTIHRLVITNRDGDTVKSYSPGDTITRPDDPDFMTTAEVNALFDAMITKGYWAASIPVDKPVTGLDGEVIRTFDSSAPQIVMLPQIVGG